MLTEVAQALGVSKSALVRRVTEAFLAEVKRTGAVQLRPDWVNGLKKADARTEWGDRKIYPMESKVAEDPTPYTVTKKEPKP